MQQQERLGVSIKYESRTIFRNVRPVADIISEFESKHIPHISLDPTEIKYGNWDIVVAFDDENTFNQYQAGEISLQPDWLASGQAQKQKVNPLKASKRAQAGK